MRCWVGYTAGLCAIGLMHAGLAPQRANAQQTNDGGILVNISLSEQLRYEDDETSARTDLGFVVRSQTRTQSFNFNLGGAAEVPLSGPRDADIDDPRFGLGYAYETRDILLGFDMSFLRADVDTFEITDTDTLVIDTGTRDALSTDLELVFGRTAPFGGSIALNFAETDFSDPNNSQIDSEALETDINLRFDLSRTATTFTTLSLSDLDRDGGTDVRTESLRAGLNLELSKTLDASLAVGRTRVENTNEAGLTATESGGTFTLNLTAERPNGTITGNLDSDITENGRLTTLRMQRELILPRGSLSAGIGISNNSTTGQTDPLFNLGYVHTLPLSEFQASLSQQTSSTSTGAETINSQFNLSLEQTLTDASSLTARLGLREIGQRASNAADSTQFDVSLSYAHEISKNWDMFGTISHRRQRISGQPETTEDVIFIGFRSILEWRP